jgi:hypothetical protein
MSSNATMMDVDASGSAQRESGEDQDLDDVAEIVEYDDEEDEIDFTDVIDTSKVSSVIRHPSSVIRHPSSVIRHPSSVVRHPSSVIRHLPYTCLICIRYHSPSSTPRALGWGGARSGRATQSSGRHML